MLRNMANYVALVHFWKLIYLCKRMKPCLTVAVFSKKKKITCLIFESKELKLCLQSEEVYSFVLYTAGGGCKSMGLKKSTCLQRFCCVGCLPLSCPRRDPELPALTLQFLSWTLNPQAHQLNAHHCRLNPDWHLKIDQSILVDTKGLISDRT